MSGGEFTQAAREAIYEAGGGRCVGCGSAQVTAQHRRARGMGGTSRDEVGYAVNGVPLCGSGTAGCHGWTEGHPLMGELLGWRLLGDDWSIPWFTLHGWRRWILVDGVPMVEYVDPTELDRPVERGLAVAALQEDVARRVVE